MDDTENELYYQAANILRKFKEKRGTVKSLIYSSGFKNLRQLFALVNECIKKRSILEKIASQCSQTFHKEPVIQGKDEVAIVLLYEFLLGRKFGKSVGLRRVFQKHKADIKSAVNKVVLQLNARSLKAACQLCDQDLVPKIPRYMRVNLIKSSVESVIKNLQAESWQFAGKFTQDEFKTRVSEMSEGQYGLDPVLPDLLVFPPGTDLHDHKLTRRGVLVQQDRASCVPAHVLDPAPSTTVLDCCAAPGNKTSHLASLLKNDGRVIALDRDLKRLGTMENLLSNSGATCVELIHQDFLTVDPTSEDAKDVQFILVDPSCSGSGILNHQTNASGLDVDSNRIQTLKRFQISILKHALSFPNVSRVVYSTCSIHSEENEEVAEEVMAQVSDKYRFRPVLKQWRESRGLDKFPHASFFLRLSPTQDLTQGFFVACFERVGKEVASVENDTACVTNKKDQTVSEAKVERKKIKKLKKSCDFPTELQTEMEIQPESVDTEAQAAGNKKNLSQLQRKKKKRKHAELDTHLDKQTEKKYCVDDLQISIKNQSSLKSLPGATGASSFKVPDPLDSSAATKKNVKKVKKNKLKGSQ